MISFTTWVDGDGQDGASAEFAGELFGGKSRSGALHDVARQLVASGAPDQDWEARGRDGKRRLLGPSLLTLAQTTVVEPPNGGRARIGRWRTIDDGSDPCVRCGESQQFYRDACMGCGTHRDPSYGGCLPQSEAGKNASGIRRERPRRLAPGDRPPSP